MNDKVKISVTRNNAQMARDVFAEIARRYEVKPEVLRGPVKDSEHELPKLVAIKLISKYFGWSNGIGGSQFRITCDKASVYASHADKLLADAANHREAEIERSLEEWMSNYMDGTAPTSVDASTEKHPEEMVSPVRVKRQHGSWVLHADDDWFKDRMFVIDGANVCHWGRDASLGCMSLEPLLWLCGGLRRRGARFMVLFDASTGYMLKQFGAEGSTKCYKCLIKEHADEFREVPAGIPADAFVLMLASECVDGEKPRMVISNDCYSDFENEYPMVRDVCRRIPGMIIGTDILFPSIRWRVSCGPCTYQPCRVDANGSDMDQLIGPSVSECGQCCEMKMTA